ncbi:hypothetical protein T439DRAFT_341488 [Meredithblackwellia eburnea MCA 4105]
MALDKAASMDAASKTHASPSATTYVSEPRAVSPSPATLFEDNNRDGSVKAPSDRPEHVARGLASRHQQMIAIGGIIGSGYWLGTGTALANGGPLGLLLGYTFMGLVTYAVAVAVGEMAALYPLSGGFVYFSTRFVDPALGFSCGWNYWGGLAITLPAEITAGSIVISYWDSSTNVSVWIAMFLVVIGSMNLVSVRFYGESEFWAAMMKIIAVVGCILLCVIIDLGGGPNHDRLGFRYWKDPGPFSQLAGITGSLGRFLSFWSTFVNAAFSYGGVEVLSLTAAEADRPELTIPRCIRSVFWRILFFYVGGVFVMGLTIPYNDDLLLNDSGTAAAAPFVIAIQRAGIKILPSIMNAVILISTFSAASSYLYAASRTVYGLSQDSQAPRFMGWTTKRGLPYVAVLVTASFGLLAFMNVSSSGGTVFNYLYTISAISCLLAWISILISYIRFRAACSLQGVDRSDFPYQAPMQPYLTYFGLIMIILIVLCNGFELFLSANAPFDYSTFIASYIAIPIFLMLFLGWKIVKKTKIVSLQEMDLTGMRKRYRPSDEETKLYSASHMESSPRSPMQKIISAVQTIWQ